MIEANKPAVQNRDSPEGFGVWGFRVVGFAANPKTPKLKPLR